MALYLKENLTFDRAGLQIISEDAADGKGKDLYMKGIFIEGGVKNANQRVYPVHEIEKAVSAINDQIKGGYSVLGEVDHPDDLKINLDRVSHMITEMWMDGPAGFGKLKVLPTPSGQILKSLVESNVKLGISSRGLGSTKQVGGTTVVDDDFQLICFDMVSEPSTPNAFMMKEHKSLAESKQRVDKLNNILTKIL